jgi:hypothetical protein
MPNPSDAGRVGLLVEFLPKFVKPVEDMLSGLHGEYLERADPVIRQMLGRDYPWPSAPPHDPFVDARWPELLVGSATLEGGLELVDIG